MTSDSEMQISKLVGMVIAVVFDLVLMKASTVVNERDRPNHGLEKEDCSTQPSISVELHIMHPETSYPF